MPEKMPNYGGFFEVNGEPMIAMRDASWWANKHAEMQANAWPFPTGLEKRSNSKFGTMMSLSPGVGNEMANNKMIYQFVSRIDEKYEGFEYNYGRYDGDFGIDVDF